MRTRTYPHLALQQLAKKKPDPKDHVKKNILRNKNVTDPAMTDVELFQNMALGDTWDDASIVSVYFYLRRNKHLVIPACWEVPIHEFDKELDAKASRLGLAMGFSQRFFISS